VDAPFPELEPVFDAVSAGHLAQALSLARQLADRSEGPLAIEARRHQGLCSFHLGDYAAAVPAFEQVARATGERQAWFVLALARTLAADAEGGARDFERAVASPEPPAGPEGRQLTEAFMRFDYMHTLTDAWQWQRARAELDRLVASMSGLARHDNEFLFDRGFPLLGDLLDAGLRVMSIVPDSDPVAWLQGIRKDLSPIGRQMVDQALQALQLQLGS